MSVMGITSAVASAQAAQTAGQVQMAVMEKTLQATDAHGEALVAMIESVAQTMEQVAAHTGSMGSNLNVVA